MSDFNAMTAFEKACTLFPDANLAEPFVYLGLKITLIRDMFGTMPKGSIQAAHVLKQQKDMIKQLNKLAAKIAKTRKNTPTAPELSETKEVAELQGVIRRYQELVGEMNEMPSTVDELVELAKDLEAKAAAEFDTKGRSAATCFLRDKDGWPMISSHMIVGNLKENFRNAFTAVPEDVRKETVGVVKYKSDIASMMALEVKPVEEFLRASKDLIKDEKGEPVIFERPLRMDNGQTAIAASEALPVGTQFSCTLRVRAASPLVANKCAILHYLFALGRNNGLGAWRGSGGKGQFTYELMKLDNFVE